MTCIDWHLNCWPSAWMILYGQISRPPLTHLKNSRKGILILNSSRWLFVCQVFLSFLFLFQFQSLSCPYFFTHSDTAQINRSFIVEVGSKSRKLAFIRKRCHRCAPPSYRSDSSREHYDVVISFQNKTNSRISEPDREEALWRSFSCSRIRSTWIWVKGKARVPQAGAARGSYAKGL